MTSDVPSFIGGNSCSSPSATAFFDVFFVHGLSGDRYKTWSDTEDCFWLKWLAEEFPACNFYTAGYDTDVFYNRLAGQGASFQDLATTLADGIISRAFPAPRVLFVTHSLGGLIVKQMIRKCSDSADGDFNHLANSVHGVTFLGTPHQGAALSTALDVILARYKSKAVKQMAYGDDTLVDLHEFFRNWATKRQIFVKAYYETQKTWGFQIVDKVSANPHVFGADPIAVQTDHIAICKPKTKESPVYRSMATSIDKMVKAATTASAIKSPSTAVVLSSGQVPDSPPLKSFFPVISSISTGLDSKNKPIINAPVAQTHSLSPIVPDGLAPDILSDYQFYTTTADADRRDLAVKLTASGRFYQVGDAERKKERFSMALRRHIAQPAAMTRYIKLMADVETRFHRHIDRLTSAGAENDAVDNMVQTAIVDPCTATHSTAGHEISASLVDSAIYYLAGNCHIRWDNDTH